MFSLNNSVLKKIVYILKWDTFHHEYIVPELFRCWWRHCLLSSVLYFPLSFFVIFMLLASSVPYIYLTLPHILPFVTLHLTLPYLIFYLLLPHMLPYLTSYLTVCYFTSYVNLPYILPYLTLHLTLLLTLHIAFCYLTLPYIIPYLIILKICENYEKLKENFL